MVGKMLDVLKEINNNAFFLFLPVVNLWKIYKAVGNLGGYDSVSRYIMLYTFYLGLNRPK